MTEPFFDHERFDVCELAGEYEYEYEHEHEHEHEHEYDKSHESSVGHAISSRLANSVDKLCLNPVTPYHSQGALP